MLLSYINLWLLLLATTSTVIVKVDGQGPIITPTHYELWLQLNDQNQVNGKVDIDLDVSGEQTATIIINCKDLDIDRESATLEKINEGSEARENVIIEFIGVYPSTETCNIVARTILEPGTYTLHLEWIAPVQNGNEGLFKVNYELDLGSVT